MHELQPGESGITAFKVCWPLFHTKSISIISIILVLLKYVELIKKKTITYKIKKKIIGLYYTYYNGIMVISDTFMNIVDVV